MPFSNWSVDCLFISSEKLLIKIGHSCICKQFALCCNQRHQLFDSHWSCGGIGLNRFEQILQWSSMFCLHAQNCLLCFNKLLLSMRKLIPGFCFVALIDTHAGLIESWLHFSDFFPTTGILLPEACLCSIHFRRLLQKIIKLLLDIRKLFTQSLFLSL